MIDVIISKHYASSMIVAVPPDRSLLKVCKWSAKECRERVVVGLRVLPSVDLDHDRPLGTDSASRSRSWLSTRPSCPPP